MDFLEAQSLILAMTERVADEKIFLRWIPYQADISFEEFKSQLKTNSPTFTSNKSTDEIMLDVKNILNQMQGGN